MSDEFDSFDESTAGAFIESNAGVRGLIANVVFAMNSVTFTDGRDTIEFVAQYDLSSNEIKPIGNNNQTRLSIDMLEYKKRLYKCGGTTTGSSPNKGLGSVTVYNNTTGDWDEIIPDTLLDSGGGISMCIHNNILHIIGLWTLSGGGSTEKIATWDGTTFSILDTIFFGTPANGSHYCHSSGGKLYVTGTILPSVFIRQVVGSTLVALSEPNPFGTIPIEMETFEDELYIMGTDYLFKWDGAAFTSIISSITGFLKSMIVFKGKIVLSGGFTEINGVTLDDIASFDGTIFEQFGRITPFPNLPSFEDMVINNKILFGIGAQSLNVDGEAVEDVTRFVPSGGKWVATDDPTVHSYPGAQGLFNIATFSGKLDFEP